MLQKQQEQLQLLQQQQEQLELLQQQQQLQPCCSPGPLGPE